MMKRVLCLLFIMIMAAGCGAEDRSSAASAPLNTTADADEGEALCEQVKALPKTGIEDVWGLVQGYAGSNEQAVKLKETIRSLMDCSGIYYQESAYKTGNPYQATVVFYLRHGVPWMSVEYNNYRGTIDDCEIMPSPDPEYQWLARPKGKHRDVDITTDWIIKISPDKMQIDWANSNRAHDPDKYSGYFMYRTKP